MDNRLACVYLSQADDSGAREASVQDGRLGGICTTRGNVLVILNAQVLCSWFCFPAHTTQALADQRDTQGLGNGKDGLFTNTGEYRIFRECSAPTLVSTEEGGLHVRIYGMGITSQITLIGSRIIMGEWRMWKVYLVMKPQNTNLGTNN